MIHSLEGADVNQMDADATHFRLKAETARVMQAPLPTVALITGASRGYGRELALALCRARPDAHLALVSRDATALEETRRLCSEVLHPAGSARCFLADLGKPAELQSLLEPVLQYLTENSDLLCAKFSKAEVLVLHNAGSLGRLAYTQQLAADSAAALDLNVTSFVLLTQMLLQRFSKQVKLPKSNVRIVFVNISSLLALQVMPSWSLYATGKAARDMYMRAVAADVQKCAMDVRTLSWAPGPMDTQMMKEILTTCPDDEVLKQFQEMEKQDRLVKLLDSAEKLMKLLKEDSFQNAAHIDFFDV